MFAPHRRRMMWIFALVAAAGAAMACPCAQPRAMNFAWAQAGHGCTAAAQTLLRGSINHQFSVSPL